MLQDITPVHVSYTYIENDADGTNWAFDAHEFSAGITMCVLPGKAYGGTEVTYRLADYNGFAGPSAGFINTTANGREDLDVLTVNLFLVYELAPNWYADLLFTHEALESNDAAFEADRNRFSFGIARTF
jgi:hypothetical protein